MKSSGKAPKPPKPPRGPKRPFRLRFTAPKALAPLAARSKELWARLQALIEKYPWLAQAVAWLATPIVAWRTRRRWRPVLAPYAKRPSIRRRIGFAGFLTGLSLFGLVYGFFFALTAPFLINFFLIPIGLLALAVIWCLPDTKTIPIRTATGFFYAFIVGLLLWPNYMAIALPGLPWITMARLTGLPMTILFLVCVSTSKAFRKDLHHMLMAVPMIWRLTIAFVVLQFITIPVSHQPSASLQKAIIQQTNWTAIFLMSCYVLRKPGAIEKTLQLICALALPICAIAILEFRKQNLLWVGHIPSFLKVDDASRILLASMRGADGIYRTKSTFSTPLGLAEYLALLTPFLIYFATSRYHYVLRITAALMIPLCFYCIRLSGSRLGVVGMLVSFSAYLGYWGLVRWRNRKGDVVGPIAVLSYPAGLMVLLALAMVNRRIHNMILGGGEAKASNAARQHQIQMAIPKILARPWGHGAGMAGDSMGYAAGQFVAVDNYYITIAMEYGILGVLIFYGMMFWGAGVALLYAIRKDVYKERETMMLMPLAIALLAFVVIKWVFSQSDNHPLVFIMLGMIVTLIERIQSREAQTQAEPDTTKVRTPQYSGSHVRIPAYARVAASEGGSPNRELARF